MKIAILISILAVASICTAQPTYTTYSRGLVMSSNGVMSSQTLTGFSNAVSGAFSFTSGTNQISRIGQAETLLNKTLLEPNVQNSLGTNWNFGATQDTNTVARLLDIPMNVRWKGATGDGTTEDTLAISNAIAGYSTVYFPAGTYITDGLVVQRNTIIYGDGPGTIIKFKTGATGYCLRATNASIEIRDLVLSGGGTARPSSLGDRSGISVHTYWGGKVRNCSVGGFSGVGISLDGVLAQMDIGPQTIITDCQVYRCGTGIKTGDGTPGGEYTTIANSVVNSNLIGAEITAGNVIVNANQFTGNAVALVYGTDGNGGHGVLSANLINHNDIGVIATNMPHSMSIIGNQSWYGAWYLTNCTKPMFIGNTLHSGIYLDSSSAVFSHNWFQSGISQTGDDTSEFYFNLGLTNGTPNMGVDGRLTTAAFSVVHGNTVSGGYPEGLQIHYTNGIASIESRSPDTGYKQMQIGALETYFRSVNGIVALVNTNGVYTSADTWHAPSFENSWTNSGGGYGNGGYIRESAVMVRLRGLISGPDYGAAFTLPAGYRPLQTSWHVVPAGAANGNLTISSAGVVTVVDGGTNNVSLDGITFRTD